MKAFYDDMAVLYVQFFNEHGEQRTLNFIFNSKVSLSILNNLYDRFVKDGVEELEKLEKDKKEKYWEISCKYFTDIADRMKACKSIYVLQLITSTF